MSSPLRVAVCSANTPPDYAGAGLSAFKLAERLHGSGSLAFVLTRTRATGNGRRIFATQEGLPIVPPDRVVRVTPPPAGGGGRWRRVLDPLRFAAEAVALAVSTTRQLVHRRGDFDVIHCFTPSWLSFHAIAVSKLLGKQVILEATLMGRDDPQARPPRDFVGLKYRARTIQYRLADRIVAISPALGARFEDAGYAAKLEVIPRSVDVRRFRPATEPEKEALRRELNLQDADPVLLFVGQIGERKGADLLVPIFARVAGAHPAARLIIVGQVGEGQNGMYAQMLAEIERHGLGERVGFVTRTGAIERYMQLATVFLFPSRREGFGTVVVEAMACGAIPAALRIPGITDYMIVPEQDGLYVEDEDPAAFARAITWLLEDPARRARIAAAGVRTVRERFSTAVIDSTYSLLYAQVRRDGSGRIAPEAEAPHSSHA